MYYKLILFLLASILVAYPCPKSLSILSISTSLPSPTIGTYMNEDSTHSNTGLIARIVIASLVICAVVVVTVVLLFVIVCLKTDRSAFTTATPINQTYGVIQDAHTGPAYDYPVFMDQDGNHINGTRLNEVHGVTGESGYSYPATVNHVGTTGDNIEFEAKRNKAYAANIGMERNEAYEAATVVDSGTASETYDYI